MYVPQDDRSFDPVAAATHDHGEELRTAPRFTLMMRTSKLIGSGGEFFCVVRDVSETGVRLRLFHPLPEARLVLELGNGEHYCIERVWEANGEAGFRFAAPIDVAGFIAEVSHYPKRPVRLKVGLVADLACRGMTSSVTIEDISQQGAGIRSGLQLETEQIVSLSGDGIAPVYARVRWSRHPAYGLVFERAYRLDELARLAWALQHPSGEGAVLRGAVQG